MCTCYLPNYDLCLFDFFLLVLFFHLGHFCLQLWATLWFSRLPVPSDFLAVIINKTIGMFMISSVILQHSAELQMEPSVWVCEVTVRLPVCCGWFLGGACSPAGITKFRLSLFLYIYINVLHFGCFLCGALKFWDIHKCSWCTDDVWNPTSAKSTLCWSP